MAPQLWPHVYVHVPFCGRRCSYCDFAIAVRRQVPASEFNDAIMAELVTRGIEPSPVPVRSIYLGGGTPSKLGAAGVSQLLAMLATHLGVEKFSTFPDELEVTLEANPEDVTPEAAAAWVAAGVNRISLGLQSFDPAVLQWMHREHSGDDARRAVETLKAAGVAELSVDLIFALPESLGRDWTLDLTEAIKLDTDHISLYGLTVEPQTPLGRWTARGEVQEAPEERYEEEFLEAHERLTAAGFEHYEVSNYGRPGHRARHNSAYWKGVPYLGLGPSAHGYGGVGTSARAETPGGASTAAAQAASGDAPGERRWNLSAYAEWLDATKVGRDPIAGSERLGPDQRTAEEVYLGLRTIDGLAIHQNERMTVTPWLERGWARLGGDGVLRLTPSGWLRLDSLAAVLTSLRSAS